MARTRSSFLYGQFAWTRLVRLCRCEQFGAGMITGWGAHHIDIAHWAMDMENSGPIEVAANAEFPKKGLWDVHGAFHVRATYANGAMSGRGFTLLVAAASHHIRPSSPTNRRPFGYFSLMNIVRQ